MPPKTKAQEDRLAKKFGYTQSGEVRVISNPAGGQTIGQLIAQLKEDFEKEEEDAQNQTEVDEE